MADVEGVPPLIFRIPNSGIEILCLAKDSWFGGVIYEPMKFADPIPWRIMNASLTPPQGPTKATALQRMGWEQAG